VKKRKKQDKPKQEKLTFFSWSREPVHVACFVSLLLVLALPSLAIVGIVKICLTAPPLSMVLWPPPPAAAWGVLEFGSAALIDLVLAHVVLYAVRRFQDAIRMRNLHDYEMDPYVPQVYAAVCFLLLALSSVGILGVNPADSSTDAGRAFNATASAITAVFLAGPMYTGVIVLLLNILSWLLRLVFGREILDLRKLGKRKEK
jgi:hypothetical protein